MQEIKSALQYIHSQIDWVKNESSYITIKKDGGTILLHGHKPGETVGEYVAPNMNNPIKAMMNHISEEMCVECLQIDYLFKDPFFISLTRAYIELLFVQYGSEVSISKEMSQAFIINDLLGDHKIQCRTLDDVIDLDVNNYTKYSSDSCIYKLIQ